MTFVLLAIATVIALGLCASTLLVHTAALKLERSDPHLLKSVGIVQVDWWLRFYRGIWRLAFSPAANSLSKNDRAVMRSFWVFIMLFPLALIALKLSGR